MKPFFFSVNAAFLFATFSFLCPTILLKLFHFLLFECFFVDIFSGDIIKVSIMSSTTSQSYSTFRVKFTVSDETSTSFISALDYLKRGKRLNPLTHWGIQVSGGG